MKKIVTLLLAGVVVASCASEAPKKEEPKKEKETVATKEIGEDKVGDATPSVFGEEITIEEVTSGEDLLTKLTTEDTLKGIVIGGKVSSVCQKKGCWMKMALADDKDIFVKFKDYEFFVPLDCEGSQAVLQGNAYAETTSVEELQHYAKDAGKTEEEIAAITEPETRYSFMASGVILTDYVPAPKEEIEETEEKEPATAE